MSLLAPYLEELGKLAKKTEKESLSEWAFLMADTLLRFPADTGPQEEYHVESKVIPTLTEWVNQLKRERGCSTLPIASLTREVRINFYVFNS